MKVSVMAITVGVLGTIPENKIKLEKLEIRVKIKAIHKSALLKTAKILSSMPESIHGSCYDSIFDLSHQLLLSEIQQLWHYLWQL